MGRVGRLPVAVALGALFNPLNSSMIAIALARIETEFRVGVVAVTWLAAGFYLTAVAVPPLMGALADRFGPRRVFCGGLVMVGLTGALAALAPSYPVLVVARLLQAFGSCATLPAGMAIITATAEKGRPAPRVIALISMVLTASAAAGPVLAGFLVSLWGWRAIFLVNVPLAAVALVPALRWLPKVAPVRRRQAWLPRPKPALLATYGVFAMVNVVFYLAFLMVPLWAQRSAGLPPHLAGLLVLPMAVSAVLMTPVAVALAARVGMRAVLLVSSGPLLAGSCVMFFVGPVGVVLVTTSLIGLASAFSQFGLNSLVFVHADRNETGLAVGLFQAARYIGAATAASITGVLYAPETMAPSGWVMVAASTLILLAGFIIPVETSDEESRQKS